MRLRNHMNQRAVRRVFVIRWRRRLLFDAGFARARPVNLLLPRRLPGLSWVGESVSIDFSARLSSGGGPNCARGPFGNDGLGTVSECSEHETSNVRDSNTTRNMRN